MDETRNRNDVAYWLFRYRHSISSSCDSNFFFFILLSFSHSMINGWLVYSLDQQNKSFPFIVISSMRSSHFLLSWLIINWNRNFLYWKWIEIKWVNEMDLKIAFCFSYIVFLFIFLFSNLHNILVNLRLFFF